jgi:predicted alpha/beta-fold hydrolase
VQLIWKFALLDKEKCQFSPSPFLKNGHLMTIAPAIWPRKLLPLKIQSQQRVFQVSADSFVLTHCHWQHNSKNSPTIIILHGLEGSANSLHVIGLTAKALELGYNVIRMNMRNCGGSIHLSPSLYNAGLSADVISVINELHTSDKLEKIFLAGFSLGGNIVLKTAAELSQNSNCKIIAVAAVSPSIDLHAAIDAIELPKNKFYEQWFLRTLKDKIKQKAKLYPDFYDTKPLRTIRRLREFDNIYTAPFGGYGNANNYYKKASALPLIKNIKIPTLVIASEDDPIVPFSSFQSKDFYCSQMTFIPTKFGGHASFIQATKEPEQLFDCFWAENRILEFSEYTSSALPLPYNH